LHKSQTATKLGLHKSPDETGMRGSGCDSDLTPLPRTPVLEMRPIVRPIPDSLPICGSVPVCKRPNPSSSCLRTRTACPQGRIKYYGPTRL